MKGDVVRLRYGWQPIYDDLSSPGVYQSLYGARMAMKRGRRTCRKAIESRIRLLEQYDVRRKWGWPNARKWLRWEVAGIAQEQWKRITQAQVMQAKNTTKKTQ